MRIWPWLSRTSTAERVGEGSSPRHSSSPVSITEKVLLVLTPSASSISVARISRTAPFSVSRPSPSRLHGVWPDPLVPRSSRRSLRTVAQLGKQEAAPVADIGVIVAELVAVIAQRQRLGQIAGQRLETAEMADPFGIAQPGETDRLVPAVVAEAQLMAREVGRAHGIGQPAAQLGDWRIGAIVCGLRF